MARQFVTSRPSSSLTFAPYDAFAIGGSALTLAASSLVKRVERRTSWST